MRRWERWAGAAALLMVAACGDSNDNGNQVPDVQVQDVADTSGDTAKGDDALEPDTDEDAVAPDAGEDTTQLPDAEADTAAPDAEADTAAPDAEADTAAPDAEADTAAPDAEDALEDTTEPDADPDTVSPDAEDALEDTTEPDADPDSVSPDVEDAQEDTAAPDVGPDAEPDAEPDVDPDTGHDTGPIAGCEQAIIVDAANLPWTHSGDTTYLDDSYSSGGCGGSELYDGEGFPDVLYAFTPEISGKYDFELNRPGEDGPTILYAATDCNDIAGTCIGWSDDMYNVPKWSVDLQAGTTYYFVLDGYLFSDWGAYELTVHPPCVPACDGKECGSDGCGGSCGTCAAGDLCDEAGQCLSAGEVQGNTCGNAFVVDADNLPFVGTGNTEDATNVYTKPSNTCGTSSQFGANAPDQVWAFTPPSTGLYTVTLTFPSGSWDTAHYITDDCGDIEGTCVASSDPASLSTFLEGGVTYYIIVDGYGSLSGAYTIEVSAPCEPQCDGKECGDDGCQGVCGTCASMEYCDENGLCAVADDGDICGTAFEVTGLPFEHSGTTSGFQPDYHFSAGQCPGISGAWGKGSSDVAYAFTAPTAGSYTAVLNADYDSMLYAVSDCADIGSTCLAGHDLIGTNKTETVTVTLAEGETVFFIVDGFSNEDNEAGNYTFRVEEPCIPMCDGKECGDDGCGGSCGTCGAGFSCEQEEGVCISLDDVQGNSCDNPFVIDGTPFTYEQDTSWADDRYEVLEGQCGSPWDYGRGGRDHVYVFTPEFTAEYTFEVWTDWDVTLTVTTGCSDIASECIAGVDDEYEDEFLTVNLTEGQTVYVIVDGYDEYEYGHYELNVTMK